MSRLDTKPWPFWKTIPRFDREYDFGDLVQAVKALAGSANGEESGLESFLSPTGTLCFARSGRECLYLILKILGLRAQSRIGVPLYCCASVFEAIAAAGYCPVFLDIDPKTYAISEEDLSRNRERLDALVVVHTFGYPSDICRLKKCLEGRAIPIIEDCAHALFSEYQGRPLGTWTEAAFFTFGMHKPAAVGGGAALLVNDPNLAENARRELSFLCSESRVDELRHSLICLARSVSYQRSAYGALLGSPFGQYRDRERSNNGDGATHADKHFPPSKIRSVDRALVRQRIEDFHRKLPKLASNTQKLHEAVRESDLDLLVEPRNGRWNHFMVPMRYPTALKRDLGRKFLKSRRIDTAPLYQNCARNARQFGYGAGCREAERVAQTICTVPNHSWLSDDEMGYIGESLRLSSQIT